MTYPKNKSKKEKTSISKKKSHHTSRQILPSIKLRTSKLNKKNVMMTVDSKRKLEAVNTNYTCAQNFVMAPTHTRTETFLTLMKRFLLKVYLKTCCHGLGVKGFK